MITPCIAGLKIAAGISKDVFETSFIALYVPLSETGPDLIPSEKLELSNGIVVIPTFSFLRSSGSSNNAAVDDCWDAGRGNPIVQSSSPIFSSRFSISSIFNLCLPMGRKHHGR